MSWSESLQWTESIHNSLPLSSTGMPPFMVVIRQPNFLHKTLRSEPRWPTRQLDAVSGSGGGPGLPCLPWTCMQLPNIRVVNGSGYLRRIFPCGRRVINWLLALLVHSLCQMSTYGSLPETFLISLCSSDIPCRYGQACVDAPSIHPCCGQRSCLRCSSSALLPAWAGSKHQ